MKILSILLLILSLAGCASDINECINHGLPVGNCTGNYLPQPNIVNNVPITPIVTTNDPLIFDKK